jgi:hypothetical protein
VNIDEHLFTNKLSFCSGLKRTVLFLNRNQLRKAAGAALPNIIQRNAFYARDGTAFR